jgi:phage protein D
VDLVERSKTYREFYAPAFAISVRGEDVMRKTLIAVSQVEADLTLGAASRFSFSVVNAYSMKRQLFLTGGGRDVLEVLTFGAEVDIAMGYGDVRSLRPIMSGMITEITTNFPETGSPELTIAGYDHAFPLTGGKSTRTWTKARDSAAAQEIAGFHNLKAKIEATREEHAQIEQNQESDLEFLKKLADRNHFEIFVDEHRTLHFHKPNDKAAAVVRLAWGEGLLSFKPEANLAGQVSRVEVSGWDPKHKKEIVGTASAGQESGLDGKSRSPGQRLNAFVRDPDKQPVLRLRQPVFTQAEADERARAALNERAKQFLTGEAEALGLPEVRPDVNVQLDKLGLLFSKTYYVQQATHKVDGNGYRVRFKIKEAAL